MISPSPSTTTTTTIANSTNKHLVKPRCNFFDCGLHTCGVERLHGLDIIAYAFQTDIPSATTAPTAFVLRLEFALCNTAVFAIARQFLRRAIPITFGSHEFVLHATASLFCLVRCSAAMGDLLVASLDVAALNDRMIVGAFVQRSFAHFFFAQLEIGNHILTGLFRRCVILTIA